MNLSIAQRFSRSAKTYDAAATVQNDVAKLLAQITAPHCATAQKVLEIGCGTGFLSRQIQERLSPKELILNDISPEMIAEAQASLPCQASSLLGDAELIPWPTADIIVSSSAVQWFNSPLSSIKKATDALNPGGILALATYGPNTFRELRNNAPDPASYPTFQQWLSAFSDNNLTLLGKCQCQEFQCFENKIQLLRMIAQTGIGTRRGNTALPSSSSEKVSLTYDIFCFVARKAL